MRIVKVICDYCNGDLTETSNCYDYRILLKSDIIPCKEGMVTDMHIFPHFESDLYFCGTGCLLKYIQNKFSKKEQTHEPN